MSQEQGIFGTVKSYIPGMSGGAGQTTAGDQSVQDAESAPRQQTSQGGGLMSYIPGFGGNTAAQETDADVSATRSGAVYNQGTADNEPKGLGKAATTTTGDIENTNTRVGDGENRDYGTRGNNDYKSGDRSGNDYNANTGAGSGYDPESAMGTRATGAGYTQGSEYPNSGAYADEGRAAGVAPTGGHRHENPAAYRNPSTGYQGDDYSAPDAGTNARATDYAPTNENPSAVETPGQAVESDVKGAPIEGDHVKGYAVSAPVGSGDVNVRTDGGDPSGQVSGAHMQYGPVDVDDRDTRGTKTNSVVH